MKKSTLTLLCIASLTACFASDLSLYKNVQTIPNLDITQPTIVEIRNLNQSGDYVIVDDKSISIEQQSQTLRTTKIIPPQEVNGCTIACMNAQALADGNESTTFDFPLVSNGMQHGKIKIVYTTPLETDSVVFRTTADSYMPNVFTLVIDGKRILNTSSGGSARFPKMIAKTIEIDFDYNQPIRFTEVGVGVNKEESVTNSVRFIYKPNTTYTLYLDSPTGRESLPLPVINLFVKNPEQIVELGDVNKNKLYKERDTDNDNVIDSDDNCPRLANADQKDGNNNGIGDMCDDYDYDGVMTAGDNCPEISNPDQKDTDRDGIGDVCDGEESRVTEKYPWMPWVVFIGVFIVVGAMGYEVLKMKKKEEHTA